MFITPFAHLRNKVFRRTVKMTSDGLIFTASPFTADAAKNATDGYKVLHLVRHAQGTHNLAVLQKGGVDGGLEDEYKNWEWYDARLTDTGKAQATSLRPHMESLPAIEVVFTSPLSRTVQTALLAIPPGPPFIAEELVRERCGTHPCDKRRSRTDLTADFPTLDLSILPTDEDTMWTEERESIPTLIGRANAFLRMIKGRKETNIAVVSHNDFLKALFYESELQFTDASLRRTFANAECQSLLLTWRSSSATSSSSTGAGAV